MKTVAVYQSCGKSHFIDNVNAKIKDTYPPIQARIGELVSLAKRWITRRKARRFTVKELTLQHGKPEEGLTDNEFAQKREYLSILLFSASPEKQRKILKEMNIRCRY